MRACVCMPRLQRGQLSTVYTTRFKSRPRYERFVNQLREMNLKAKRIIESYSDLMGAIKLPLKVWNDHRPTAPPPTQKTSTHTPSSPSLPEVALEFETGEADPTILRFVRNYELSSKVRCHLSDYQHLVYLDEITI